jgi:hypothetical protein
MPRISTEGGEAYTLIKLDVLQRPYAGGCFRRTVNAVHLAAESHVDDRLMVRLTLSRRTLSARSPRYLRRGIWHGLESGGAGGIQFHHPPMKCSARWGRRAFFETDTL